MATLALLDGHSLAYRAFYALPSDLATPAGQVTNAVFGFTSMLIKLLGDESPDALAVAWDVRGPQFRKERYPEYKAQRESPPDLFAGQLPLIREVLDTLKIEQISAPGFEADDVIATLATEARADGWEVLVVTGDRDSFQLVDADIQVMYTLRGISDTVKATPEWIKDRYGVTPGEYRDYAALRGDTSDNLPGVPGVGEKTAAKLIQQYGDLEGIYEHVEDQTPKLQENLREHRDQVFLNRELMDLIRTVELEGSPAAESFTLQEWDRDTVKEVFDGLAFRVLWERLLELGGESVVEAEHLDIEVVTTSDPVRVAEAAVDGMLTIEPVHDAGELAGIVVAGDPVLFVPSQHIASLGELLGEQVSIAAHDGKAMVRELLEHEVVVSRVGFDTALAAYIVNPAQRTPDLEELAYQHLGLTVAAADEGEEATPQVTFDFDGSSGPDLEAAGRRAVAIQRLIDPLREQIDSRGGLGLFEEIELPLVAILARMEETGVGVDREFLVTYGDELRARLAKLEASIHEAAGGPFNVNSTLQLREVLFDRLELTVHKKTAKGVPSTDAGVLEKLKDEHPMVESLLEFRSLEKLRSTYVDAMLPLIEPDGRVRGRFNQMAAATGRLSQEQPNLQNIPVRTEEGRAIRKAFVADTGNRLLVADYSQIELRILAHLSEDASLVEAFINDEDIHTATAARVNGIEVSDVTPDIRRRAKVINFGLLYGMEAYGLGQRLGVSRDEASEHVEAYFAQFPDVQAFMKSIVDRARTDGFTTTLLGRRRYLPELASGNFRDRQMGERMALNAPIQGSAADIIKKAMVELEHRLRSQGAQSEMLLQIHDELVIEAPDDEADEIIELTKTVMEDVVELIVPLRVDTASGANLAECKA